MNALINPLPNKCTLSDTIKGSKPNLNKGILIVHINRTTDNFYDLPSTR